MAKGATSLPPKGYVPPKPWEELNDSEKIERMREIIKSLQSHVGRTQTDIHKLKTNFNKHSHSENKILVPYDEYGGGGDIGMAEKSSRENYF